MENENIVIILNFDKGYMNWGKTLIESLAFNAPKAKVVAYTVNLNNKDRKNLYSLHHDLTVHNRWILFFTEKMKRHFLINRKAGIFLKAIKNYPAKFYLLLDADMILIRPITRLINECISYQAGVVHRDYEKQYHMKLNASLVIINKNKGGDDLIRLWKKTMTSNFILKTIDDKLTIGEIIRNKKKSYDSPVRVRKGSWFWDQLTLYYAVMKSGLQIRNLPPDTYLNSVFDDNAVFWSGHSGNKKITLGKFKVKVEEMKKSIS